jgi:hypothetical protein
MNNWSKKKSLSIPGKYLSILISVYLVNLVERNKIISKKERLNLKVIKAQAIKMNRVMKK